MHKFESNFKIVDTNNTRGRKKQKKRYTDDELPSNQTLNNKVAITLTQSKVIATFIVDIIEDYWINSYLNMISLLY